MKIIMATSTIQENNSNLPPVCVVNVIVQVATSAFKPGRSLSPQAFSLYFCFVLLEKNCEKVLIFTDCNSGILLASSAIKIQMLWIFRYQTEIKEEVLFV